MRKTEIHSKLSLTKIFCFKKPHSFKLLLCQNIASFIDKNFNIIIFLGSFCS